MMDILWKRDDWVFSYRVAGICVQNGKVLLQKRKKGTLLLAGFPNPVVFQNRLR